MINCINDDQLIVSIFFIFLGAYIINPVLHDEIYISNKIEISEDLHINSYKNYNIEKFKFDFKNIIKDTNSVINNNFELLDIYMMNNFQILDWSARANNLILRLNNINNQNILMLINNNYDVIINQGELLLENDPRTDPNLRQRLENEIQRLRVKLSMMNAFKVILRGAMWVGCFYYLVNSINNFSNRFQSMNQLAGDFRDVGNRIVDRNFSNLSENRSIMTGMGILGIHTLYMIIKRIFWFRRGGK